MTVAGLILNLLIMVLLGVTIAYCWILNRRIKVLQDSKSELAQLLGHFDESTQRASESIIALQTASKKIGENIQLKLEKANYLIDDLSFMIEKGNKLANQMEADIAINRAKTRVMADAPAAPQPQPKAMPVLEKPQKPSPTTAARDKMSTSLEAVLERITKKPVLASETPELPRRPEKPPVAGRSRAEQELLDMIKAGIKG